MTTETSGQSMIESDADRTDWTSPEQNGDQVFEEKNNNVVVDEPPSDHHVESNDEQPTSDGGIVVINVLELELELENSDRYCYLLTTKGKKAESLYKSPDFFQMTIKSFFKTI